MNTNTILVIRNLLFTFTLAFLIQFQTVNAQEGEEKPVRSPFETVCLIETPTIVSPPAKSLVFTIKHRFGLMDNGISDIFGIYGSANTRLGLDYGITDKIMVGFGTEQQNKLQEFRWKYAIFQQTRSGSMPVALSYYGNCVIDGREKENFTAEGQIDYKFTYRMSYYTSLIVARKFNKTFSFQVAPNFIYYNAVKENVNNMHYGISAGGRARVLPSVSVIAEYNQLLSSNDFDDEKPNLSFGAEIGSPTHAFHVFVTNFTALVPQQNFVYNTNDFTSGDFLAGFNITVRF